MIRFFAALLVAGVVLSACGSVSPSSAMNSWVNQSSYYGTAKSLTHDARHAATALKNPALTSADLHTVCAVLDLETEQANASLPTPDDVATSLLSKAYNTLGAGAVKCYGAGSNSVEREKALESLSAGVGYLAEGSARIQSDKAS